MKLKMRKLTAKIHFPAEVLQALERVRRKTLERVGPFVRRMARREEIRFLAKQAPMIGEGI